jgi:hypothetical protein
MEKEKFSDTDSGGSRDSSEIEADRLLDILPVSQKRGGSRILESPVSLESTQEEDEDVDDWFRCSPPNTNHENEISEVTAGDILPRSPDEEPVWTIARMVRMKTSSLRQR